MRNPIATIAIATMNGSQMTNGSRMAPQYYKRNAARGVRERRGRWRRWLGQCRRDGRSNDHVGDRPRLAHRAKEFDAGVQERGRGGGAAGHLGELGVVDRLKTGTGLTVALLHGPSSWL